MFWWYHSVFLVSPSDLRGLSSIFICFGCVVVVTVALGVAACQPVSPVPATCAPLYSLLSIFLEIFLYKVNEWMQFSVRPPQSDSAPIEPWKVLSSPLKYARRECGQVSQPCRNSQAVWFMIDILTTCRSLLHNQWALIWFELFKPTTLLQQLNYSAIKHICFY